MVTSFAKGILVLVSSHSSFTRYERLVALSYRTPFSFYVISLFLLIICPVFDEITTLISLVYDFILSHTKILATEFGEF